MTAPAEIAANLQAIRDRIENARRRARRDDIVTLVAVSKTVGADRIVAAFDAGQRVFGENRVQEGTGKIATLSAQMPGAAWHLIGHLQSNKARAAVDAFTLIESVDSAALAHRLDVLADRSGRTLPVLLEVNVAGEASKHGFLPDEFRVVAEELVRLEHLEIRGLMTVAPLVDDAEKIRSVFRTLRQLRDWARDSFPGTGFRELSMGMSGDFEMAIEEGATMVRIGRAIFGERPMVQT
jgi:pyridoxal phosphate enzyme (YggS family)